MNFEVYGYTMNRVCHLKNKTLQNVNHKFPRYIKWNFKDQNFIINTTDPSENFVFIGKDYLILQYRKKSEEYPHPRNVVIYNFNTVAENVVEAPFLKTAEVTFNHKNLQASFDDFYVFR